jgi:hypothetical protein
MTDEDRTASKLKGYNCLIKFKDGEELLVKVSEFEGTDDDISEWFSDVERFINGEKDTFFPLSGFAVEHGCIKYVKKL